MRATILSGIGLKVSHLTPNKRYDATFVASSFEDDPYPYYFGMGGFSTDNQGRIFVVTDPGDLIAYKSPLYEVQVWLREPGTSVDAPAALDLAGFPIWAEIKYDYGD